MVRIGLLITSALLCFNGRAQTCFHVASAPDRAPLGNVTARCADGTLAGTSNAEGLLCLGSACDTLLISAPGYPSQRLATAELLRSGTLLLRVNELFPVTVEPWPRKRDRHGLASVSVLDSVQLAGFDRSSLRAAAQWTPGVQWDQRGAGGSQRLSMRGSLLRSAFGVRGVKVYWGPFPLTLADGSTPLELLDPMMAGSVDVVRSIGSPIYGSAPSGMLLAQAPFRTGHGADAALEVLGGSYGYYRTSATARTSRPGSAFTAGLVRQRSDGYRAQEWSERDQVFVAAQRISPRHTGQLYLTWQNAGWALPGSLDSLTAATAPRSARPYSQAIHAHIDKHQLMGGAASDVRLGAHLRLRSTLHAQLIDKRNPYGTTVANCGYKDEVIRAAGGRLSVAGDGRPARLPVSWEVGMEALAERDRLRENSYVNGQIGALKVDADTRVLNLNAFAMSTTRLAPRTVLQAGVGAERTTYDHRDGLSFTSPSTQPVFAAYPTIALEHVTRQGIELHARYAEATSRATVWEYLGTSGNFNNDLRGERVKEVEIGGVLNMDSSATRIELTAFRREMRDLILSTTAANGTDQTYVNTGRAVITGAELRLNMSIRTGVGALIRTMLFAGVHPSTVHLADGQVLTDIPGSAGYSCGMLLRAPLPLRSKWVWEFGGRVASAVRASTENDERVPGFATVHGRIAYSFKVSGARVACFAHVENLLDDHFSSWVQVNDPGGRYFNPAPGRSFLAGVSLAMGNDRGHRVAPTRR